MRLKLLVIDDTDLSSFDKGQQYRTYNTYFSLSKYLEINFLLQKLSNPSKLRWANFYVVNDFSRTNSLLYTDYISLFNLNLFNNIMKIIKNINPDLIILEHIYGINRPSLLASKFLGEKIIYNSHGEEIEVCKNSRCKSLIYPVEYSFYKLSDYIFSISYEDAIKACYYYNLPISKFKILPMGIRKIRCNKLNKDLIRNNENSKIIAVFHGNLDYEPNLIAFQKILNISKYFQDIKFIILGNSLKIKPFKSENVEYLGYVEDIDHYLCLSDFAIAPLVEGTGVKTKILDYISARLPIITTRKGIEGINVKDLGNYPIFVYDEVNKDFLTGIQYIMKNIETLKEKAIRANIKLPTWDDVPILMLKYIYEIINVKGE
ncbi:glycosyltransferase [Caldisphaera lagunensis]|nr:glycosyltransferase [Caldisphaera lagunensis]